MKFRKASRISKLCVLALSMFACHRKSGSNDAIESPRPSGGRIRVPIVFHVVFDGSTPESNIGDQKIASQIDSLNETFQGRNADLNRVPASYADLIADVGLEFYLATVDPSSQPSTGIERIQEDLVKKQATVGERDQPLTFMKRTTWGGLDAWPSDRFLNIWVVNLSDEDREASILGKATFPGEEPALDGLVLDYRAVGNVAPLIDSYELGRTATHEIGHWLGLHHLSAQVDDCSSWDCVEDTPQTMGVNFMEQLSDAEALMFTEGQKSRMLQQFSTGGARRSFSERSE